MVNDTVTVGIGRDGFDQLMQYIQRPVTVTDRLIRVFQIEIIKECLVEHDIPCDLIGVVVQRRNGRNPDTGKRECLIGALIPPFFIRLQVRDCAHVLQITVAEGAGDQGTLCADDIKYPFAGQNTVIECGRQRIAVFKRRAGNGNAEAFFDLKLAVIDGIIHFGTVFIFRGNFIGCHSLDTDIDGGKHDFRTRRGNGGKCGKISLFCGLRGIFRGCFRVGRCVGCGGYFIW